MHSVVYVTIQVLDYCSEYRLYCFRSEYRLYCLRRHIRHCDPTINTIVRSLLTSDARFRAYEAPINAAIFYFSTLLLAYIFVYTSLNDVYTSYELYTKCVRLITKYGST